ncbi:TonB-dependent receptor domain-containing protein [Flavobacterium sp.]|uniref:TonB-dependent receptor domain-containing protein n=1 Tax=Flavobacterium sp. TaxID=239 RepID=UPI003C405FA3
MKNYLFFLLLLFCCVITAQNSINGSVININNEPVLGVNISVEGDNSGTVTDSDGKFIIRSSKNFPWTLSLSCIGYESQRVNVISKNQKINIVLNEEETILNEIVISASRTPERIFESPVTIERMSLRDIKKTASPSFYDGLENMKEVQMNTSSLTFKSINTRGFATVANTRFMQLVDGMDNSSPLLNFVLGNMIGISEIDVQSVELLPGASSALYGANAFNGIMFMNSKNPFDYQGISTYLKYGQTSQKAAGNNGFYDFGIRMAHAFDKHFAAKVNMTFMEGTDWYATNYDDRTRQGQGITRSNNSYDGMNVYGDEAKIYTLNQVGQSMVANGSWATNGLPAAWATSLPNDYVTRTGYNEVDLTNNKAANTKVDFSLHFRPLGDERVEVIWQSKFGLGNAIYQGANRYYLNNFFIQQHKLEIKGNNFFVRGYTTSEDGGKSYDMNFTGTHINEIWKSDPTWYGTYAASYAGAYNNPASPLFGNVAGSNDFARAKADVGRLIPGTTAFQNAFNTVIADASSLTGSKLVDNSKIYHSDINYNLKDLIKFGEIQVGGSYREYQLNSHGRIYTDANSPINYNEYGLYTQLQKKILDDRLKFTGSIRYDKAQNFKGNYSPRVSLGYSAGENRQHNFRASFQTGFRNPTTQDQYIGFNVGYAALVGSAPDNLSRFTETFNVATPTGISFAGGTTATLTGSNAYNNSYTKESVVGLLATGDPTLLKKTNVDLVKPEEVKAFELGYRSQINKITIDINGYYNVYNNFIGNKTVFATYYGEAQDSPNSAGGATDLGTQSLHALQNSNYRIYQLYTNTPLEINSLGIGIGLSKKFFENYDIGLSYNYAQLDYDQDKDPDFETSFNTPKHRVKLSLGNDKMFKNFGFNISGRWYTEYMWESTMADGLIASATVIDAQVNYDFPSIKSVIKIGAANLGGKEYTQVLGAGAIGRQIFASFTIKP